VLKLASHHLETICTHAERIYPEECCGLLLGYLKGEDKILVEVRATENAWNAEAVDDFRQMEPSAKLGVTKRGNYAIAPADILKAQREARDRNLHIIGIYHSHPDHFAIPSAFDTRIAWQQYSYIIISVSQGQAADAKSWCLDDTHQFQPEEIQVVD
jgi:proteasome lid subunit RPN8/RPN11